MNNNAVINNNNLTKNPRQYFAPKILHWYTKKKFLFLGGGGDLYAV
jgi:hypothetical protein